MRIHGLRQHVFVACVLILLVTAGCFQQAGGNLQATSVAQIVPTFTVVPSNTPIPSPTPEPATETPVPTEEVTEAPTEDVTPELEASLTPSLMPTAFVSSTPDMVAALMTEMAATAEVTENLTGGAEDVSLVTPTLDPMLLLTAPTFTPTSGLIAPTFTPTALEVAQADTPVDEVVDDPIAITATFIVQRATQTASAPLTQTAAAQGIGLTTPTAPGVVDTPGVPGVTPAGPTAIPATLAPGSDCIHEVQATDRNLYRISLDYGSTVEQIARASGIANINLIYVGQTLTIPGCGTTGRVPPPTSTPNAGTGSGTGSGTGTTTGGVTGGGRTYVVQQGDTLFEISLQTGVLVNDIAARNGISNINLIYIGQELVIP
jgi:LysM repeat protein